MKVKELIKQLRKFDPKATVVLSRDAEGNGYSPVADLEVGFYTAETSWCGDFLSKALIEEETYEIDTSNAIEAIAIWPIN